MAEPVNYHERPEWSYSQMKQILDHGIDWAVAAKRGEIEIEKSKAMDIGTIVHQLILGGDENIVVAPFDDFRTKEAREWKKTNADKIILKAKEMEEVLKIVSQVKAHPVVKRIFEGKHECEVEMFAKVNGVEMRGKADLIELNDDGSRECIYDLKTVSDFDAFMFKASRKHLDLQAATYKILDAHNDCNYRLIVAETVEPYRVKVWLANYEFIEAGERKLSRCIEEILKFGDKIPNFLIEEEGELGDCSL